MTLMARIAAIDDGDGTLDLTLEGNLRVQAEYFDDSDPGTVLAAKDFVFGVGTSLTDAQERLKAGGRAIRDARQTVTAGQSLVGTTFPLD